MRRLPLDVVCDNVIPHRPPMALIDGVESFDLASKTLTARVSITPQSPFYDGAGVPNWAAVEYMAQTAAALTGVRDRVERPDAPPRPGFLLGTRKLDLGLAHFEPGRVYRITATCEFEDGEAAAFACAVRDEAENVVASATLNAYRPQEGVWGDFAPASGGKREGGT